MTTAEIAEAFAELIREGRDREAGERFWSEDVTSLEPVEGDMARLEGAEAIRRKLDWWESTFRVIEAETRGPYLHGDRFALWFRVKAEGPEGVTEMEEIGLYTVRDGRVVEERFFAGPDG